MLCAVNAVDEPSKTVTELVVARALHHRGGLGAQRDEHAIDASPCGDRVAERKARRDEPYDFLVARSSVAMNAIDRVARSSRLSVASCEQGVQLLPETVHFPVVLALLRSPLQ
jgi:hypothetical protein